MALRGYQKWKWGGPSIKPISHDIPHSTLASEVLAKIYVFATFFLRLSSFTMRANATHLRDLGPRLIENGCEVDPAIVRGKLHALIPFDEQIVIK